MGYYLGDITLPTPAAFSREYIETSAKNELINGYTKKDIANRKEKFILKFSNLTQAQVSSILSEYNLMTVRNFYTTETNLTITSTPVHIEIEDREYSKGSDYRESFTLILTEVV